MSVDVEQPVGLAASVEVAVLEAAVGAVSAAGVPIDDERLRADLEVLLPLRGRLEALVAERLAAYDNAVHFLTPLAAEHDPAAFAEICQRLRDSFSPEPTDTENRDL